VEDSFIGGGNQRTFKDVKSSNEKTIHFLILKIVKMHVSL
jgi:hypothetical protein